MSGPADLPVPGEPKGVSGDILNAPNPLLFPSLANLVMRRDEMLRKQHMEYIARASWAGAGPPQPGLATVFADRERRAELEKLNIEAVRYAEEQVVSRTQLDVNSLKCEIIERVETRKLILRLNINGSEYRFGVDPERAESWRLNPQDLIAWIQEKVGGAIAMQLAQPIAMHVVAGNGKKTT